MSDHPQRFEYDTCGGYSTDDIRDTCNGMAEEGWRLVSFAATDIDDREEPRYVMVFERPFTRETTT